MSLRINRPGRVGKSDSAVADVRTSRIAVLAQALNRPLTLQPGRAVSSTALHQALTSLVRVGSPSDVWLALAVMSGAIPSVETVKQVARESELLYAAPLASALIDVVGRRPHDARAGTVEVTTPGTVLVDVSSTLTASFTTGIQRVVRETVARWEVTHDVVPVTWTADFSALRRLTEEELARVRLRLPATPDVTAMDTEAVGPDCLLIPWRCTFVEPEVMAERARSSAVRSIAMYARCETSAVVHDCLPLTFSETLIDWFGDTFAHHLAALRHFDRIVAVSAASGREHAGWRHSLEGTGWSGPAVGVVTLPAEVPAQPPAGSTTARSDSFVVADLPMVLVVGSSEPRKNHDAILYAAEVLWRRGHRFSLTFVGGRAWGTSDFARTVRSLSEAGRPIDVATGVSDGDLYRAYRLARFSVFPSLAEGFGLPVAESLACGTPVITSNFGSMKEIADPGGAIQLNPHSDAELIDAMELLLTDDDLVARLKREAMQRRWKTWDEYAKESWSSLVEGYLVDVDAPAS